MTPTLPSLEKSQVRTRRQKPFRKNNKSQQPFQKIERDSKNSFNFAHKCTSATFYAMRSSTLRCFKCARSVSYYRDHCSTRPSHANTKKNRWVSWIWVSLACKSALNNRGGLFGFTRRTPTSNYTQKQPKQTQRHSRSKTQNRDACAQTHNHNKKRQTADEERQTYNNKYNWTCTCNPKTSRNPNTPDNTDSGRDVATKYTKVSFAQGPVGTSATRSEMRTLTISGRSTWCRLAVCRSVSETRNISSGRLHNVLVPSDDQQKNATASLAIERTRTRNWSGR